MKKIALIGLGKQTQEEILPALLLLSSDVSIVAICDTNTEAVKQTLALVSTARPYFSDHELFEKEQDLDAIIVCVPHFQYFPIIETALQRKIAIFKEKPFALNYAEAKSLYDLSLKTNTPLFTVTKRTKYDSYVLGKEYLDEIGVIYQFFAKHIIPHGTIYTGWRSDPKLSGGGVLLDLGYHLMDVLIRYFGIPKRIVMAKSNLGNPDFSYTVEDAATLLMKYENGMHGCFQMGCLSAPKEELIEIRGTKGTIVVKKNSFTLFDRNGDTKLQKKFDTNPIICTKDIIKDFFVMPKTKIKENLTHHLNIMKTIENAYLNTI